MTLMGWGGDPHLSPFHPAGCVFIGGGFWLIAAANGYGIARAYAGHTDSVGLATTTYIKSRPPGRRHYACGDDRPNCTRSPTQQI
jgi:hypothetical protein